jgi:type II secretory pathway predicted ATPase ExeA
MFGQKKKTAWFFDSSVHLEAISRLRYLIEVGESIGTVCGPDGCGRTRILTRLREETEGTGKSVVSLNASGIDEQTALTELTTSISSSARRGMARYELVSLLRDEVAGRVHCGVHTVILIDDLHRAQSDMQSFLRLLTALNAGNSNDNGRGKLTVIAASDRSLTSGISLESSLQVRLTPLDCAESAEFVRALVRHNRLPVTCFDNSAIDAIFDLSRGNTASITRICEIIAVLLETSPKTQVTAETVSAVIHELAPRAVA